MYFPLFFSPSIKHTFMLQSLVLPCLFFPFSLPYRFHYLYFCCFSLFTPFSSHASDCILFSHLFLPYYWLVPSRLAAWVTEVIYGRRGDRWVSHVGQAEVVYMTNTELEASIIVSLNTFVAAVSPSICPSLIRRLSVSLCLIHVYVSPYLRLSVSFPSSPHITARVHFKFLGSIKHPLMHYSFLRFLPFHPFPSSGFYFYVHYKPSPAARHPPPAQASALPCHPLSSFIH